MAGPDPPSSGHSTFPHFPRIPAQGRDDGKAFFIPTPKGAFMSTLLPTDANNFPIPALRLRTGGSHSLSVTATSARNATAFNAATRVIGIYATAPVFVRLGGDTVTAVNTDHYIPADTYMDIAVAGDDEQTATHLAAIRASSDGTLYVSEKF